MDSCYCIIMSAIIHCFFCNHLNGCLEWHFRVHTVLFMSCALQCFSLLFVDALVLLIDVFSY